MSSFTLYDAVIPLFTKGLKTFDHILTKAEESAKEQGLNANAEYPEARLIEDQKPLIFQVQIAAKTVKTNIERLTGVESAPLEDDEKTFEDLHAKIHATLDLLKNIDRELVNSRTNTIIRM
jgi:hypothetical protein